VIQKFKPLAGLTAVLALLFTSPLYAAPTAPDFSLKGDRSTINLSAYRGKVVYLDFWASWCKPCRKSFPFLNEMHDRYRNKGLQVIGINLDPASTDAQKFLKKYPASFAIAYDPAGQIPAKYQLSVMPTSYLIDRKGNIVETHKGFREDDRNKLESTIKHLLNIK